MHSPPPDLTAVQSRLRSLPLRERKEAIAALALEKRLREARHLQSDVGEQYRAGGLLPFVRYFWHLLEPNTKLVEGMPMRAVCLHLEAVTRGEIKRLIINVSPGSAKSLLVNVFWPLWEWSAAGMPWLRYVTFAYAAYLTERDNQRFRDIIRSSEFKELWGHVFTLTSDGQVKPSNDKTGWKFSSSWKGVGTGERGHRILCFPAGQKVATEIGPIPIGDIVNRRLAVRAWSLNTKTNTLELKPITGWHRNPGRQLIKVTTESGATVTCTHDHKIYTPDGPVAASDLLVGGYLLAAPRGMGVACTPVRRPQGQVQVRPRASVANVGNRARTNAELGAQCVRRVIVASRDLAHDLLSQMRRAVAEPPVAFAIGNVLGARAVSEVALAAVHGVPVEMTDLLPIRARPDKSLHQQPVDVAVERLPIFAQANSGVSGVGLGHQYAFFDADLVVVPDVRSAVGVDARPTLPDTSAGDAAHAAETGYGVEPLKANDCTPLLDRVARVDWLHDVPSETFCVTVGSNNNLICGGLANIICSNCDDLHNVKEGESEAVLSETVRWAREGMSNRLNDMEEGVIILIGQQVNEKDVSNTLLKADLGYVHVSIPNEYDPSRHCVTDWWEDPRTEDMELAWPERFPAHVVDQIKRTLGPYAYNAQYQQSPEPRGGGIIKRDWWGIYELDVGAPFRHKFEYILASLDPAFTAKQENDPSGFTVWGVYYDKGNPRCVLLHAWKKWLELHGQTMERLPNESNKEYVRRASPGWGLVEWVVHDCSRLKVHKLLVEDKASGHSVAQELRRLYSDNPWHTHLYPVGALDKRARAYAVQHLFADGIIEAPASARGDMAEFREWAQMTIDECAKFRGLQGDEDNLVDSTTQALKFLRDNGLLLRGDERRAIETERMRHKGESPRRDAIKTILSG